jgi:hypothetical protein
MTNARDNLIAKYSSLQAGVSLSGEVCPKCLGGRRGEKSLSVSKSVGGFPKLLWKCHRNSCKFKGQHTLLSISDTLISNNIPSVPQKPKINFERTPLDTSGRIRLYTNYYLSDKEIDLSGLEHTYYRDEFQPYYKDEFQQAVTAQYEEGRCVIPLKNRDFTIAGYNLYAQNKYSVSGPKSIIVKEKDPMGVIWFNCYSGPSGKVIIVEDCYSAIRASKYMNAVALLGTYLSPENVRELKSFNMARYFLALDSDAQKSMVETILKYKDILPLEGVTMNMDIKNMRPALADAFFAMDIFKNKEEL